MDKILIGSHNSMTYLPPKYKFLKFFDWLIAKCQNKDIYNQLLKVDCVDIRVYYKNHGYKSCFAHGLIKYKCKFDEYELLDYINKYYENKYVRLILEDYNTKDDIQAFKDLCDYAKNNLTNITFLGGNKKDNWEKLYDFENGITDNDVHQFISSMADDVRWYERICPRLYAKRMNKVNKNKLKPGINLFDFIDVNNIYRKHQK